jgi:hypothetical protein
MAQDVVDPEGVEPDGVDVGVELLDGVEEEPELSLEVEPLDSAEDFDAPLPDFP